MAESLGDRQFETLRRVAPGRKVQNRKDAALHSEEYATAVTGPDGTPLGLDTGQLLRQMVLMQAEQNQLLLIIAAQLGATPTADQFPETMSGSLTSLLMAS